MENLKRLKQIIRTGTAARHLLLSAVIAIGMVTGLALPVQAAVNPTAVTVGPQDGSLTFGAAGSVTYQLSVTTNGGGPGGATIAVAGLPVGADWAPKATTLSGTTPPITLTISTLANSPGGSFPFTVTVANTNSGNAASGGGTLTIDAETIPPTLTISTLSDGSVTNNPVLNITGVATDASGIGSIVINGEEVDQYEGYFNTAFLLVDGMNSITVTAKDAADNTTEITRNITLEFEAPALTVSTPADGSTTVGSLIDITGAVDVGSTVDVIVNGSSQAASVTDGIYVATVNLDLGINTIEIVATDLSSNTNSIKRTIEYETQGLSLQMVEPKDDMIIYGSTYTVEGIVADYDGNVSVTVNVDGNTYTPSVDAGAFQQAVTFSSTGMIYPVMVTATDDANQISSIQRNFVSMDRATLAADVPSPQVSGASVTFSSGANGGSGAYEYQFLLQTRSGSPYAVVQDFSQDNTWVWDTGSVPVGAYFVTVYVRDIATRSFIAKNAMLYYVLAASRATGATLTANLPSPQIKGAAVTFTAGATSSEDVEYKFAVKLGAVVTVVQDYSTDNTWEWDTGNYSAGAYSVYVYVRNQGSPMLYEATKALGYTVLNAAPATGATLTANQPSPKVIGGEPVVFTAGAISAETIEYQFKLKSSTGTTIVQNWSTDNTWEMNTGSTGYAPDIYVLYVYARNQGSSMSFETSRTLTYTVVQTAPATAAKLTSSLKSPQTQGTIVMFTAGATSTSPLEYQFRLKSGTTTTVLQDYSSDNTWQWNTGEYPAGIYTVYVYVRNVGSVMASETYKGLGYTLN